MRIAVCSCVHGRTETTEKFLDSLYRLIQHSHLSDIEVRAYIAVTPGDPFFELLKKHDAAPYVTAYPYSNDSLGGKWNYALSKCYKSDYIMITGSDDLYSRNYLTALKPQLDAGYDYLGPLDFYFYDAHKKAAFYFPGYTADRRGEPKGAGRIIKTSIVEQKAWALWPHNASKGLDAHFTSKINGLAPKRKFFRMADIGVCCIDVKTAENIHPVSDYQVQFFDKTKMFQLLNA